MKIFATIDGTEYQAELAQTNSHSKLLWLGHEIHPEFTSLGYHRYRLKLENRIYLLRFRPTDDYIAVLVDGEEIQVKVETERSRLINELARQAGHTDSHFEIKAPIPGLVVKILVNAGETIVKGDKLLILEAMKMENVIKSPVDGAVESILTQSGKTVQSGERLLMIKSV
jgi:biotin carboxyl carrier protein